MRHDFGLVRELVHRPNPGKGRWRTLCSMLHDWPARELRSQVLPYLEHHLESWPWQVRIAPRSWVEQALEGRAIPLLRLARRVRWHPWLEASRPSRPWRQWDLPGPPWEMRAPREGPWPVLTEPARELLEQSQDLQLLELNLPGALITKKAIDCICQAPGLRDLRVLKLCGFGMDLSHVGRLATAPFADKLRELHLTTQNFYTAREHVPDGRLREENLQGPQPGVLGDLLGTLCESRLEVLNLLCAQVFDEDLDALVGARALQRLHTLRLGGSQFTSRGLTRLLRPEHLPRLRDLSLSGAFDRSVDPYATTGIVQPLCESGLLEQLEHINLRQLADLRHWSSSQGAVDARIGLLSEHLHAPRSLDLRQTSLSDEGLQRLIEAPGASSLEELSIDVMGYHQQEWGSEGFSTLVQHPHFANMRRLQSHNLRLDGRGLQALARSRYAAKLEYMYIVRQHRSYGPDRYDLQADDVDALLRAPGLNPRLKGQWQGVQRWLATPPPQGNTDPVATPF